MEKLIELLNEYTIKEKFGIIWKLGEDPIGVYGYVNDKYGLGWASKLVIISKEYGFIKWLVENDKIDIKALVVKGEMRSGWDFENKKGDEETGEESWNKYFSELCLMILAIQDEPIEFLASILK